MKLFTFILSSIAVLGAAATFGKEYGAAFFARSSDVAAFERLADGAELPQAPLSNRATREVLMTCGAVQQGLHYALQPSDVQDRVDASCARIATTVLVRNPTYAAAHTIIMTSSRSPALIAQSLIRSQATAPREAWHAELRLLKGLSLYGTGNSDLDRATDQDITFLVQSFEGRSWLARLYQERTAQRPAIVQIIQQRPTEEQSAFLREVKQLGQN